MSDCVVILSKIVKPVKKYVYDATKEYVSYVRNCDSNLGTLRDTLSDVCDKKLDIDKKVRDGRDDLKVVTREATSWLKDVRILSEDEELRYIMDRDVEVAKAVVKMMEQSVLKRLLREDNEMQKLVVKVIKVLKKDIGNSDEADEADETRFAREDYKKVAEVIVEVMKDTTMVFKQLMKSDRKMAIIATKMLKDDELKILAKDDKEMEEILMAAEEISEEELWQIDDNEDQEEPKGLLDVPLVGTNRKRVKETATKLLRPLRNLVTPLGKLMDDENFRQVVPGAESVILGFDVIDGLVMNGEGVREELENAKHRKSHWWSSAFVNYYHRRYKISKSAKMKATHIQDLIVQKCPADGRITVARTDLMHIPTQFEKGLESRSKLLHQILDLLREDKSDVVGIFGMGGAGKTTLAREVDNRAKDMFHKTAMVEISDVPDIMRIQGEIAGQIGLSLPAVNNVVQRALMLYTQLNLEKDKKTLIILDNIWKKLNLDEVGIPSNCKLLLTTRDREVCRIMGVEDVNTLEAGLLNMNEARNLFKSQAGHKVEVDAARGYSNVVDRLLGKCEGLPLAIVATANTLKDKDLRKWQQFARDLEKPISSHFSGDHSKTYLILDTSYKFIESEEKRKFFLLACLSPIGSSISIESLMRYGIGLDLFPYVNKLSEAMEKATTWADELVSSSMLLKGDIEGHIKIHDVVRDFGISFAAKDEGHKFMVEAIPRWLNNKSFSKYTAISLLSANDCYSRLDGVEADNLQILLLKGDLSLGFPNSFFKGMANLEVLALSNMNFQSGLPESIRNLKKLKSLYLESCKLGDLKGISELVNLLVLSLCKSFLEESPNEIGALCNLRLLDMTGCICKQPLIAAGIIGRLANLEGLYMFDSKQITSGQPEETSYMTEFNKLQHLNTLEVHNLDEEMLQNDSQFVKNMDNFRIRVGSELSYQRRETRVHPDTRVGTFHGVLDIYRVDISGRSCVKALLKKADWLKLSKVRFKHLVPDFDKDGLRELRYLKIEGCHDVTSIVNAPGTNALIAFPILQSLKLKELWNLKMLCDGDTRPGIFSKLQVLSLHQLPALLYFLPLALVPHNLTNIKVRHCKSMKFIFIETSTPPSNDESLGVKKEADVIEVKKEADVIELPFLTALKLEDMDSLTSLSGPENDSNIRSSGSPDNQDFFSSKVVFPSLKQLQLVRCCAIKRLWSEELGISSFQNLRELKLNFCRAIPSIGSPSVFSALVRLESLAIWNCREMEEVISEETDELEIRDKTIVFPQLKDLKLELLDNLRSFYRGRYKLKFPKLTNLDLTALGHMRSFVSCSESPSFFNEKVDFPCLEVLQISHVDKYVTGLCSPLIAEGGSVTPNQFPMLRKLTIGKTQGLRLIPHVISKNLSCLTLKDFDDEFLFSSPLPSDTEELVCSDSLLPELEILRISDCGSLRELFDEDHYHVAAAVTFCAQLRDLSLIHLPNLNLIPFETFRGLESLYIEKLSCSHLMSADDESFRLSADESFRFQDPLQQLKDLLVTGCDNMEALIQEGERVNDISVIEFPRLEWLSLGVCKTGFG